VLAWDGGTAPRHLFSTRLRVPATRRPPFARPTWERRCTRGARRETPARSPGGPAAASRAPRGREPPASPPANGGGAPLRAHLRENVDDPVRRQRPVPRHEILQIHPVEVLNRVIEDSIRR